MAEKPILFSGPMVRAILAGRKTQTRRVIGSQPIWRQAGDGLPAAWQWEHARASAHNGRFTGCYLSDTDSAGLQALLPQFAPCQPGDTLWVRETWQSTLEGAWNYRATSSSDEGPWGPSIFMPRAAARIFLRVTAVRVERVQDISYEDALAEGVADYTRLHEAPGAPEESLVACARRLRWPQRSFAKLWDSLNAKRGYGWDANPWVWVYEFERVR